MRKEVVWAIIGGIILGLIVAFGVYRINSTISSGKNSNQPNPTPTPVSGIPSEFKIVLNQPENDDVVTQDSVIVNGITKPSTYVLFSSEDSDFLVTTDATGAFAQSVDLVAGINQIKVTALSTDGNQSATQVLVVYSASFLQKTAAPVQTPQASGSATATGESEIRAKVAADVANITSHPKAYIGTVTDITDSTVEIKTQDSQIQQISMDAAGTTVTNTAGTTNKTVKTTDIAIGDFVVAMGYVDTNSVLSAQRILITDAITPVKISIGIAHLSDNIVNNNRSTSYQLFANSKATDMKLGKIGKNDNLIYVNIPDSSGNSYSRSLFDITPPQS